MGGLSPNLTPDGDAPNIYRTDGRGKPLNSGSPVEKPASIPGRYDPYSDRFDPDAFSSGMVAALSLASVALIASILTVIVAVPTAILRRFRRRKSS